MSAQLQQAANGSGDERMAEGGTTGEGRGRTVGGAVLIGVGLVLLAGQVFTIGNLALIVAGLLFVGAGIATREYGWFIPGGVLNGIGLGATLSESGLLRGDIAEGGLFLLAFGLGWASITLFTRLFARHTLRWPLIPAAVMGLIGTPLLFGAAGEAILETVMGALSVAWPLALVLAGLAMLRRRG
jgi:hypothetical protein